MIGREKAARSMTGVSWRPVAAHATWLMASMPITAGNRRLPSSRWSAR
ncbi:hypothetical protein [Nonomuraea rubra]